MTSNAFNEIRERVFTVVRDSSRTLVTETDVDLWMGEAIEDLTTRLHLGQEEKTGTTSGNTIDIPDDYVDLIWLKVTRSGSDNDYVLWRDDDIYNSYAESGAAMGSTIGRVFNGNFEMYPTPDTGTAYTLRYWASSSSSLANVRGSLRTRIVNYSRAHAKYKEGDMGAGDRYMELYERNLPAPDNMGPNRLPGPYSIRPEGNWFTSGAYLS